MSKESKDTKSEVSEEVEAASTGPEEVNVEVVEDVESAEKTSEDVPGSIDTEEDYKKACRMIQSDTYFSDLVNKGFFNAKS